MRLDWSEVDALVVGGVERAGFFRFERQIAEALAGAHFHNTSIRDTGAI